MVHGDTGLPAQVVALHIPESVGRDHLLRADKIAVPGGGIALVEGAEALAADLQPVVDDHIGLQGAHHLHQRPGLPRLPPHLIVGKVEPEDIQLSVVFAELPHLPMHIFQIPVKVPVFIGTGGILPHGVIPVAVMGVVGMVPVQQGVVKAHPQALRPEGIEKFPDDIPAHGGIGGLELRERGIKQAEAVVVLGGEDGIAHARLLCGPGPCPGVEVLAGELIEEGQILTLRHPLRAAHPLAPGGDGIESPVKEQPEPRLPEPLHPRFIGFPFKLIHGINSPFIYLSCDRINPKYL